MRGFVGFNPNGANFLVPLEWRARWLAEGKRVKREATSTEEPFIESAPVPMSKVHKLMAEAEEAARAVPPPLPKRKARRARKKAS